ncbi:trans-aconitate 2-methyltransferase [Methylocystis heyeri]|uniref:Trans-aconitate 2-methyltransferase n=1 Tax=Methylocystis heyeri TaxID=391905 RepID=A0A6B8KA25_9HYPH|nr:trans-aconitate 2-methyltransferase [Methylocystis heyeri]
MKLEVVSVGDWDSALYMKFEHERTRAAIDLLAQVPDMDPKIVYDLGCGPGNSATLLKRRFPRASVIGVDNSDNMLQVARQRVVDADFIKEDIESWRPREETDLVFANASLHFVPEHYDLMVRLVSCLRDGGCLAVQMPNNMQEDSHALMRMVAADGPWADRLVPVAKSQAIIGPLDEYYRLLAPICSSLDIWQTTYIHPVDGPDRIVEWFEGAELQPFLKPLCPAEKEAFLARYRDALSQAYAPQPNGKFLLRYPRLFFVAQK